MSRALPLQVCHHAPEAVKTEGFFQDARSSKAEGNSCKKVISS